MSLRTNLEQWILDALATLGGEEKIVPIAREIWRTREKDIEATEDGLFTWQYDMRWAGQSLSKKGKIVQTRGKWALK